MKPEEKHYRNHGMREGDPGDIEPNEIDRNDPAKTVSAKPHLNINQSQLGRDQGQTPADEHIDDFSQIDNDSRANNSESMDQTLEKEFDTEDFRRVDERDSHDSSEDWNAEKSRTGRSK